MGIYVNNYIYIPFAGIRIKKIKPAQTITKEREYE